MVEFPLDTVKVRLQTQNALGLANGHTMKIGVLRTFNGPLDCLLSTIRTEGFRALYSGMAIPLAGTVIDFAMMFWVYGRALALISGQNNTAPAPAPLISHVAAAGAFSGLAGSVLFTPIDLVKNRLQLQQRVPGSTGLYRCPWDVIVRSVKQDGLRVLYRGHSATLAMEIPGMCAWFTTYEWCKRTLSESTLPGFASRSSEPTGATTVVAGAAAGVAYWSAFYPADTVRSEVQTRVHAGASPSFLQVFREVYQGSGVRGLYRGLSTAVIRAIPGNAVCFSVYELVAGTLHDRFDYLM